MSPDHLERVKRGGLRLARSVVIGVAISLIGVLLVGRPYQVVHDSMRPTLAPGTKVLVVNERLNHADLGDVIVVKDPLNSDQLLVKRLVGLQGDVMEGRLGILFRNGTPVSEPYLPTNTRTPSFGPLTVGYQEIFVVGDNRLISFDSRDFGPIPRADVVGVVQARLWPSPGIVN